MDRVVCIIMESLIFGRTISEWIKIYPVLDKLITMEPVFWINKFKAESEAVLSGLAIKEIDMRDAQERWRRFAPLIEMLFPETKENRGIIESRLLEIKHFKDFIKQNYGKTFEGKLFLKCDNELPVAGSIKARGGIYEVLKYAESLAMKNGLLNVNDDYSIMSDMRFKDFFNSYSLVVGSTGNLGLSIGIMGAALGFTVKVHMSLDAKEWKKEILRNKGVMVIEHSADYSKAVAEGRRQSELDNMSYFIDDEHSVDLFLGYSVAALRLKSQLDESGITIDADHPLFVYLPCGVGGAPGGICFGLKHVFGDNVHCFFVEPTHSPCMLIGLMTGMYEDISVQSFGIDNITEADGLAVGTPSGLAARIVDKLISGIYTVNDSELFSVLKILKDNENINLEPSAISGLLGPYKLYQSLDGMSYLRENSILNKMDNAVHIAWATGGLFVPDELMVCYYNKGAELLSKNTF